MKRVAVIGAGPMGVAAALGAIDRGLDVTVFEKGQAGQSLRSWGSTRFFSPLRMNISHRMREILGDIPADDELLTGGEFIDRVLRPIVTAEPLRSRIRTQTSVLAVGRRGMTRTDYAGHPLRAERPFHLLVQTTAQEVDESLGTVASEEIVEADFVLDASGGYTVPNAIGSGGLPAIGEAALSPPPIRTLAALEEACAKLSGKRVLLIGDGHSAANAIAVLAAVDDVEVTWAVRGGNAKPCQEVFGDPLSERQRIVEMANSLAEDPPLFLTVERKAMVERFDREEGQIRATLSGGRVVMCDAVAAFTGFHPSDGIRSELTLDVSPVTLGGAGLHRAVSSVNDRLAVPRLSLEDLKSGEPGFYFVGSRAWGRAGSFLLQSGLAQLETILDALK